MAANVQVTNVKNLHSRGATRRSTFKKNPTAEMRIRSITCSISDKDCAIGSRCVVEDCLAAAVPPHRYDMVGDGRMTGTRCVVEDRVANAVNDFTRASPVIDGSVGRS